MTHKKLTLFGANKRPPKSRSKLKQVELKKKRELWAWSQRKKLTLPPLIAIASSLVIVVAVFHVKYCTGLVTIVDEETTSYHDDTQQEDKLSETPTKTTQSINVVSVSSSEPQTNEWQTTNSSTASSSYVSGGGGNGGNGNTNEVVEVKFPLYMRIIATLFCLLIFSVGVCGNLLVPLVVIKTKYLRNSTNLFLINLSIADLLVLIVCMPTVLIELHSRPETWLLGEPMCKLSNYIETLAANGSILTILAISFERYYAICKPLKAGYKCTRLRATIIICFIWLLTSILTSPILIMAKSSQTTYIDGTLVHNCILETDTYWPKMYVFVSMFAFFCLPLLVLMLVYWLIGRRLIRENLAMSRRTAAAAAVGTSHCPSTATASTDLISDHHQIDAQTISNHSSSNGWYQAVGFGSTVKRIGLRKAASLKSISGFFASFALNNHHHHQHNNHHHHYNHHDHNYHHHQHHCRHQQQHSSSANTDTIITTTTSTATTPTQQKQHQQLAANGVACQQRRQSRLKAGKAFSLDSHARIGGKQAINCAVTNRTTTIDRHERPIADASSKLGHLHGLSSSCKCCSSIGRCCCCCSCCHQQEVDRELSLPKSKQKSSDKREIGLGGNDGGSGGVDSGGIFSSFFNQIQLTQTWLLSRLSCFWSMEKHAQANVSSCSTSIEIGGNQDRGTKANGSDCNNNNNGSQFNVDHDMSSGGGVGCGGGGGGRGRGSCSCSDSIASDINGLSSSCHSRRADGITIMNSISETMPFPAANGQQQPASRPDSRLANIPDEQLVIDGESMNLHGTSAPACRTRPLIGRQYANDDDDPQAGAECQEVDDPRSSGIVDREPVGHDKSSLRSWLARSLYSYSRASGMRRYCCRADSQHEYESRSTSSEQDNGPLMTNDKAPSSGPLIAIRRTDKPRDQQYDQQPWWRNDGSDEKSTSAIAAAPTFKKVGRRGQKKPVDEHYEHRNGLKQKHQAKKSAHFDISTNCTFSWQRQQQATATNLEAAARTTTSTNSDAFNSFNCAKDDGFGANIAGLATAAAARSVRRPDTSDRLAPNGRSLSHGSGSYSPPSSSSSSPSSTSPGSNSTNSNSKSPSPDSILHGMTLKRQRHSDQIMGNPLEEGGGSSSGGGTISDANEASTLLVLQLQQQHQQTGTSDEAQKQHRIHRSQPAHRALESRPSSVAALSGSSASSGSCTTTNTIVAATTTASATITLDRDSLGKSSVHPLATPAAILFVESSGAGKSYQECQEGKQLMTTMAPITSASVVTATAMAAVEVEASPTSTLNVRTSSDQYKINDKSSRANSLVLDGESSVKRCSGQRINTHHLAKKFRTRSASKPIVCSQLHNGAHLSELLIVQDLSKKQQMDSRRQVVIMLAFVVACFFLLFFPYRVFTIWLILSTEDQVQSLGMETYYNLTYFSRILIYLHSAINPIAYNLISTKFRRAFMSILLCRGSSTRRHFTTDHQQRLANQLSYHQRKASGSTNKDHHLFSSRGSDSTLAPSKRQMIK